MNSTSVIRRLIASSMPSMPSMPIILIILIILIMATTAFGQSGSPPDPAKTPPAPAQTPPAADEQPAPAVPNGTAGLSAEEITKRKQELEGRADPNDATKQAIQLYGDALAALEEARKFKEATIAFEQAQASVAADTATLQGRLAEKPQTTPEVPAEATLDQLKQLGEQAGAALAAARDRVKSLDDERAYRTKRRAEIPVLKEQLQTTLTDLAEKAKAAPGPDEPAELTEARRAAQLARRAAAEAQLDSITKELVSYDATRELLLMRQQLWANTAEARSQLAAAWTDLITKREKAEAELAAKRAQRAAADAQPVVRKIAEKNLELTNLRSGADGVVTRKAEARESREQIMAVLQPLIARYDLARQWVTVGALADVGVRLRTDRATRLPNVRINRDDMAARREQISSVQFELADWQYAFKELPPALVAKQEALEAFDEANPDADPAVRELVATELDQQLAEERSNYRTLIQDGEELLDLLLAAQREEQRLVEVTESYRDFIDERIIWIRSASPLGPASLKTAARDFKGFLLAPGRDREASIAASVSEDSVAIPDWGAMASAIGRDAMAHPYVYAPVLALLVVLLVTRKRQRAQLAKIAKQIERPSTDTMGRTSAALLITLLLASWSPILLWFLAWRLQVIDVAEPFPRAIAAGLDRTAMLLMVLETAHQLCLKNGVGDVHIGWAKTGREVFTRNLRWFIPVTIPVAFFVETREWQTVEAGTDDLGRLVFMVGMIAASILVIRILRPSRGMLTRVIKSRPGGWLERLRYLWYGAAVGLPLVLATVAGFGYYYTAIRLERLSLSTVWVLLGAMLVFGLVVRWLKVIRRRLLIAEARERRAAQKASAQASASAPESGETVSEPRLDAITIDTQARKLVRAVVVFAWAVGTWLVWVDLLPALNALDRVELWPHVRIVEQIETGPRITPLTPVGATAGSNGAASAPASGDKPAPAADASPGAGLLVSPGPPVETPSDREGVLTLADVLFALVIVALTVIVTTNLPGILEIIVLQRLPLQPSSRYAISTIVRYVFAIIGVMLAFSTIGLSWSKLQWLVAALSVGLGFGLQEIVANFICGLIILFERPVRLGDTVTVGAVSGTVTRIQIRATTIRDWDRKELIIPNKQFITGEVINWSLSDALLRLTIKVGVAYGSDTELVKKLLLDAAASCATSLRDPPPMALFVGFGDNSLNFELRVIMPHLDHFVATRDELNRKIDNAFRAAGIEISFPQRDLHIRSMPPGLADLAAKPEMVPNPGRG